MTRVWLDRGSETIQPVRCSRRQAMRLGHEQPSGLD